MHLARGASARQCIRRRIAHGRSTGPVSARPQRIALGQEEAEIDTLGVRSLKGRALHRDGARDVFGVKDDLDAWLRIRKGGVDAYPAQGYRHAPMRQHRDGFVMQLEQGLRGIGGHGERTVPRREAPSIVRGLVIRSTATRVNEQESRNPRIRSVTCSGEVDAGSTRNAFALGVGATPGNLTWACISLTLARDFGDFSKCDFQCWTRHRRCLLFRLPLLEIAQVVELVDTHV